MAFWAGFNGIQACASTIMWNMEVCSYDLKLDQMTFVPKPKPDILKMYLLVCERRLLWSTLHWPCTKTECQKVPLYPKLAQVPLCLTPAPCPPPPLKWKFGSSKSSFTVGLQISKYHFTPPPPPPSEKLAHLELSSQVGLFYLICFQQKLPL